MANPLAKYKDKKQENPLSKYKKKTKKFEGFEAKPYRDTQGVSTIGYGFNLENPNTRKLIPDDVLEGKRKLKKDEANKIFRKLYRRAKKDAKKFVGEKDFSSLPTKAQAVVTDMSYNMGLPTLKEFQNFKKALKEKDYQKAAKEMKNSKWYDQTGRRSKELTTQIKSLSDIKDEAFRMERTGQEENPLAKYKKQRKSTKVEPSQENPLAKYKKKPKKDKSLFQEFTEFIKPPKKEKEVAKTYDEQIMNRIKRKYQNIGIPVKKDKVKKAMSNMNLKPKEFYKKIKDFTGENKPTWGDLIDSLKAGASKVGASYSGVPKIIYEGAAKLSDVITPDDLYQAKNDPVLKFLEESQTAYEEATNFYRNKLTGATGLKKFLARGVEEVPRIGAAIVGGYGTLQTNLTGVLGSFPHIARMTPFGIDAASSGARQAEKEGANYLQQVLHGLNVGMGEMATEAVVLDSFLGTFSRMGGDRYVKQGAKTLIKRYGKKGLSWASSVGKETLQEVFMEPIEGVSRKGIYKPKAPVVTKEGLKRSAYGGASMAVVMGALGLPVSTMAHRMVSNKVKENKPLSQKEINIVRNLTKEEVQKKEEALNKKLDIELNKKEKETYNNIKNKLQPTKQPQKFTKKEKRVARKILEVRNNFVYGVERNKKDIEDNEIFLGEMRQYTEEKGRDVAPREQLFRDSIRKDVLDKNERIVLESLDEVSKNRKNKWKNRVAREIKREKRSIKRNPKYWFDLSRPRVEMLIDYIEKDLKNKNSELRKLNSIELQSINKQLKNYKPPTITQLFKSLPPLKSQFVTRKLSNFFGWAEKISPWDKTLRPALIKLKKLGFGGFIDEGLTENFFNAATERVQLMNRYYNLRENWMDIVGNRDETAENIFNYLDGNIKAKQLKQQEGNQVFEVTKQIRKYLDLNLKIRNRHRAQYGEKPIKRRRNYITHLMKEQVKESLKRNQPISDYVKDKMPYIIPKKKRDPYVERKGKKEFKKNVWGALDALSTRTSQVVTDTPIRQANRVIQGINKKMKRNDELDIASPVDWKGIKQEVSDYIKYLQGRPGKYDKYLEHFLDPINFILKKFPGSPEVSVRDISNAMVTLIYGSQMAYRPKMPIRNLGQESLIIGQTGFKNFHKALKTRRTKKARKILEKSKLLQTRKRAFGAETQSVYGGKIKKAIRKGMVPFRGADKLNVQNAFLSGYYQAKKNPKKWGDPIKRGEQVAALTQYVYLKENRSDLARGFGLSRQLGRPFSVFTTWPVNYVEFNLATAANKKTRGNLVKYWATALVLAGIGPALGIKLHEYTGISSPLIFLRFAQLDLPIMGIVSRPDVQVIEELVEWLADEKSLLDIFMYTYRDESKEQLWDTDLGGFESDFEPGF